MSTKVLSIEPAELVQWYEDSTIDTTLIVDVREHDYIIGKVKGSVHFPFHDFPGALDDIAQHAQTKNRVVFHCYFSQTRGPRAARQLLDYAITNGIKVDVYVLEGGWKTWNTFCRYKNYEHLLEPI